MRIGHVPLPKIPQNIVLMMFFTFACKEDLALKGKLEQQIFGLYWYYPVAFLIAMNHLSFFMESINHVAIVLGRNVFKIKTE